MTKSSTTESTTDRVGSLVSVGTLVRVLTIDPEVFSHLTKRGAARVRSMLGETFPVYEVDRWGRAWVEKWWQEGEGRAASHSVALAPDEMEIAEMP